MHGHADTNTLARVLARMHTHTIFLVCICPLSHPSRGASEHFKRCAPENKYVPIPSCPLSPLPSPSPGILVFIPGQHLSGGNLPLKSKKGKVPEYSCIGVYELIHGHGHSYVRALSLPLSPSLSVPCPYSCLWLVGFKRPVSYTGPHQDAVFMES